MSEAHSFDNNVKGLAAYYEQLVAVDPDYMDEGERPPFYGPPVEVRDGLRQARRSLSFSIGCHALVEYSARGYNRSDLRESDEAELLDRASILAMMTAPPSPEDFFARADQVKKFLDTLTNGGRIAIAEHRYDYFIIPAKETEIDLTRSLHTTFGGHISGRIMALRYDQPNDFGLTSPAIALNIAIPRMFEPGVINYPEAA